MEFFFFFLEVYAVHSYVYIYVCMHYELWLVKLNVVDEYLNVYVFYNNTNVNCNKIAIVLVCVN